MGQLTRLVLAMMFLAACPAWAAEPIDVWFDVDPGTGTGDVDDGLMLIQAFHSPEVRIRGVSVVFGNAPLEQGLPIAQDLVRRFGPAGLEVFGGAASAQQLGDDTPAVAAMAAALNERPLTVLAVGPLTNIGTLIQRHPELSGRIERLIVVAGRRSGQRFVVRDDQEVPFRDFNFELDPVAAQRLLETQIPLVLAPWEVSSHVWLTADDLQTLSAAGASGRWIAKTSGYWLKFWQEQLGAQGFNPFDTLALGYVTHPQLIEHQPMRVAIEVLPDDRPATASQDASVDANAVDPTAPRSKPYLVVRPLDSDSPSARKVSYCFRPRAAFKPLLLERLAGTAGGEGGR